MYSKCKGRELTRMTHQLFNLFPSFYLFNFNLFPFKLTCSSELHIDLYKNIVYLIPSVVNTL